jgi:hypothetical protein
VVAAAAHDSQHAATAAAINVTRFFIPLTPSPNTEIPQTV